VVSPASQVLARNLQRDTDGLSVILML
jgi:hypothetical protein